MRKNIFIPSVFAMKWNLEGFPDDFKFDKSKAISQKRGPTLAMNDPLNIKL